MVDAEDNRLFASLPPSERKALRPFLTLVSLQRRTEINGVGSPLRYIHFPITAVISLLTVDTSHRMVEAALIGEEGCSSSYVVDGLKASPCRTLTQIAGLAFRLKVSDFRTLLPTIPRCAEAMRRFNAVAYRHSLISVGCSTFHSVEQRLGRWLLAHRHRTGRAKIFFTQSFLAQQLGVQRVTVTKALAALHDQGLVKYRYGVVEVLDIRAIKKAACQCFGLAKKAIDDYLIDIKSPKRQNGGLPHRNITRERPSTSR